jgi:hypothetical protein
MYKTKEEVEKYFVDQWQLPPATEEEKKLWSYQDPLNISFYFLIGKKIKSKRTKEISVCKQVVFKFKKAYVVTDEFTVGLSSAFVELIDPFSNSKIWVDLHPKEGRSFWTKKFVFNQKIYKSLYYKTEEYLEAQRKTLNTNLGTTGLLGPGQSPVVKDKIQKALKEKFGVHSFLCRGKHYNRIESVMLEKYGSVNLFMLEEWQDIAYKNKNGYTPQEKELKDQLKREEAYKRKINSVSKAEIEILNDIVSYFKFTDCYYYSDSNNTQILIKNPRTGKYYKADFYDKKENIIIEINGDHWHCNPKKYSDEYIHPILKLSAKQIREKDLLRKQDIINCLGCKFVTIWISEWYENKQNIYNLIKSILKS